ncbi:MAG: DNA-binding transcriptional ArsR family regulator [Kiritimatiellia bacterium]|jgi:DNA-binding transcriptional ArsR family regulator
MSRSNPQQLTAVFSALSDPTRRQILARLAEGPATVTELSEPLPISMPAVSRHLKVLEAAGLMRREKQWRTHTCHLVAEPLQDAGAFIDHYRRFWRDQLDQLAAYVESEDP